MKDIKKMQKTQLEMLLEINRISKKYDINYYLAYGTALGAIRHQGFIPWDTDIDIVVEISEYEKLCNIIEKEISEKFKLSSIDTECDYDSLKARVALKGETHHFNHVDIFPLVGTPNTKSTRWIFSKMSYILYRIYFVKKVNADLLYNNNSKKKKIAKLAKLLIIPIPTKIVIKVFNKLSFMYSIESSKYLYNICGSYGQKEYILKKYYDDPVYKIFEGHMLPLPKEWDKYLKNIYGDYMIPRKNDYV